MVDESPRARRRAATGSRTLGGAPRPSSVDRESSAGGSRSDLRVLHLPRYTVVCWIGWPGATIGRQKDTFHFFTGWRPRRAYPEASTDQADQTRTKGSGHHPEPPTTAPRRTARPTLGLLLLNRVRAAVHLPYLFATIRATLLLYFLLPNL